MLARREQRGLAFPSFRIVENVVFERIVEAGKDHGLMHGGFFAINSMRIEKGYRHWGHDITDEDTPIEAGLGFALAWDKPSGFRGRDALLEQRDRPRTKRLIQFKLHDPDRLLYHDEPIFRDGELVGRSQTDDRHPEYVRELLGTDFLISADDILGLLPAPNADRAAQAQVDDGKGRRRGLGLGAALGDAGGGGDRSRVVSPGHEGQVRPDVRRGVRAR